MRRNKDLLCSSCIVRVEIGKVQEAIGPDVSRRAILGALGFVAMSVEFNWEFSS